MQDYIVGNPSSIDDIFARPPRGLGQKQAPEPVIEAEPEPDNLFASHTRACATCGAEFQTCGKGKRCSRCLVGPGVADADTRITCRVCEAQATVPIDHPALLCRPCLTDLDATRARVQSWLTSALARHDANQEQWQTTLAMSDAAFRWPAIQGALIAVAERRATPAALNQTWQKRKAEGGALAQLLIAYEGYAATCDQLAEELEKLNAAQREINTAFLATEL